MKRHPLATCRGLGIESGIVPMPSPTPVRILFSIGLAWASVGATACRHGNTAASAGTPTSTRRLNAPFDVEFRRDLVGQPLAAATPDIRIAAPIRDVNGVSFYVDAEKSVADPALKEQNAAALKPLRDFVLTIVTLSDQWVKGAPARPEYAGAVMNALSTWAEAGALLGTVNRQGAYEREWTLGSLAIAYLKVRDAPGIDPAQTARVQAWLAQLARVIQPDYERPQLRSNRNNHAYWVGMAVAATGIACGDRALFDWGVARGRIAIAQIQQDGMLPLERDRRTLALHYHVFALSPLVMLAEMAAANGINLYEEGDGAIRRLAELVMGAFANPVAFADRMDLAQEIKVPPRGTDLAWAEAYCARFPDPRLRAWVNSARPLFDVRLGGDMTALLGARPF